MQRNRYIDDDVFDENGLLRDGKIYHTRMTAMDAHTVGRNAAKLTDAAGRDGLHLNRPGYRCLLSDTAGNEAVAAAYRQYLADLENAWKTPVGFGSVPGVETGAGERGTIGQGAGDLCTPRRRADARTVSQMLRDHRDVLSHGQRFGATMEAIMTKQALTLEKRIDIALQPETAITSAEAAALIEEAEVGIAKAEKAQAVEQTLSLNPAAARQAIADATFAANRLRTLVSKLHVRYQQLRDKEEATAWLAQQEPPRRERDALAKELREVYPAAVTKIVDLFVRIIANNNELIELGQTRPSGVERLSSAELHARGLDTFSRDMPSLLTAVHLVDLDTGRQVWPPPKPSITAACAATAIPGNDRRFTADWAQDNERRAEGQRAEQQRHADFLARLTKEQEERENREAQERVR
jgi:hypothetical protein